MSNRRRSSGSNDAHRHGQSPQADSLVTRRKERAALNVLATCMKPYLGGLSRERMKELQLILKNPVPMPRTAADIAADRQRRAVAMAEINEAISKLPPLRERHGSPLPGDNVDWAKEYLLDDLKENAPSIQVTRENTRGHRVEPPRWQNPKFLELPRKYQRPKRYSAATRLAATRMVKDDGEWEREEIKEPPELPRMGRKVG